MKQISLPYWRGLGLFSPVIYFFLPYSAPLYRSGRYLSFFSFGFISNLRLFREVTVTCQLVTKKARTFPFKLVFCSGFRAAWYLGARHLTLRTPNRVRIRTRKGIWWSSHAEFRIGSRQGRSTSGNPVEFWTVRGCSSSPNSHFWLVTGDNRSPACWICNSPMLINKLNMLSCASGSIKHN